MKNLGAGNGRCWEFNQARAGRNTDKGLASQAGRLILGIGGVILISQASLYAGDGSTAPSPSPSPSPAAYQPFIPGLIDAFGQALTSPAYTPPQPGSTPTPRRGYAAPFDSPPFFTSDFQIGGTQIIGDPGEATVWPLMKAIYGSGTFGQWLKDHRINLYGWVDGGYNVSSSSHNNNPMAYDLRPDQPELDQFVVYLERLADEYQTDHIDFGFRISALYGLDYRYTIAKGLFSSQLLKYNEYYGIDMPMVYLDLYIPWVADGMNIRIGRYISLPDIEAQLAPNNPMYTHSILYTFDPYTQQGVMASIKLNPNWTIQLGVSAGNDQSIWDSSARLTGTAMVQWISPNNMDSVYIGINSINDGEYSYNNLQDYVGTWTHKFNDVVNTQTEAWYMYMKGVPGIGWAPEWAVVNYTFFRLSKNTYLNIRNEYFDDASGQRTGVKDVYSEHAIGLTWWPNSITTIRPEIRFERAYQRESYDNHTRKNQVSFNCDMIIHF
ncbi:MAG: outer membrane beta-barrel protein [Verrucomicrobia bacterium]|nr:outer membrane beta-barrel protein [Verrucomicrobiota bacterium]